MTDDWGQSKVGRCHSPFTDDGGQNAQFTLPTEQSRNAPAKRKRGRENKNGFWKRKFEEETLAKDAAKEDVGNDGANKEKKKKTQQKLEWSFYPK